MNNFLYPVFFVFLLGNAMADTTDVEKTKTEEEQGLVNSEVGGYEERITALVGDNNIPKSLANESIRFIKQVLTSTRDNQDTVYAFVRTVNRNMDGILCDESKALKGFVREKNQELIEKSYTDDLNQNANLDNQIKTRLPRLVEDSLMLCDEKSSLPRIEDFRYEYTLLSKRYMLSRRFRVGIGISNTYLPQVSYLGRESVDLSPFEATTDGSDRLLFVPEFANENLTNFNLIIRVPYTQIDVAFPTLSSSRTSVTPVNSHGINESEESLLVRSTIVSTLGIDYDITANFALINLFKEGTFVNPHSSQVNWGFGFGATGIKVHDAIDTDVRTTTEGINAYADLPTRENVLKTQAQTYILPFVTAYYAFEVSDELQLAVDLRYYWDNDDRNIAVQPLNISLRASWFPTFPF